MPEEIENSNDTAAEDIEKDDAQEEAEEIKTSGSFGNFLSPEGIIMLMAAGLLDLMGLIILLFGLDDLGILDIIGLIIIGGWIFFRSGVVTGTARSKKVWGKILKRAGLSFLIELFPYIGSLAPCWIAAVYFELKNS